MLKFNWSQLNLFSIQYLSIIFTIKIHYNLISLLKIANEGFNLKLLNISTCEDDF